MPKTLHLEQDKIIDIMMRLEFFEYFSKIDLQRVLIKNSQIQIFDKGDFILRKDEVSRDLFIILDGDVLINTDYQIIKHMQAGMFFGEISFINNEPRTANVIANDECIIMKIDKAIMENLHISIREKIKDQILKKLIYDLKEMNIKFDTLRNLNKQQ